MYSGLTRWTPSSLPALVATTLLTSTAASAQTCPEPAGSAVVAASVCAGGIVETVYFDSVSDLRRRIEDSADTLYDSDADFLRSYPELADVFTRYDGKTLADFGLNEQTSAAEARIDLRGLPMTLSTAESSSALTFSVPSLGVKETFDGGSREASGELLAAYLENNYEMILKELLEYSPIDPVAGNPASVQAEMVTTAFEAGSAPTYDNLEQGKSFGIGARFGSFSFDEFDQDVYTLPLSFVYTFANFDRLIVNAPLSYTRIDNADGYRANFDITYRKNINGRWSLSPGAGYGVTYSDDLGSLGHILSASLTSDFTLYEHAKFQLSMGNMIAYYQSMPVRYEDIDIDQDLSNNVLRNGLLVAIPWQKKIWGRDITLDVFVTDTRFFGDEVYSDNFQEIGFSFGPRRNVDKLAPNTSSHPFGIGLKYVHGEGDIDGLELNFAYRF